MHVLLRADQRPKQNLKDVLLPAHLQELYLSVNEYGLLLNQELNPIKRTQWQKTERSSSAWTITSRRTWSDRILEIKRLSLAPI